jgi:hypothetical protein
VHAVRLSGDPLRRLKMEMGRGRQPNPGRGHLPRKEDRLAVEVPGYAGDIPYTNLKVEL